MKLMTQFKLNIMDDEYFIAPRPLPGKLLLTYFALVCVNPDGKNFSVVKKFKQNQEITLQ